jgi:hypothetical protein
LIRQILVNIGKRKRQEREARMRSPKKEAALKKSTSHKNYFQGPIRDEVSIDNKKDKTKDVYGKEKETTRCIW